jgi:protein-disulfide isomerase
MPRKLPFWLLIALSIASLAASAILFVDYLRPAPVFCAVDGGCGLVRQTIFARPFGVPMPVFGVAGYLAIALLAFLPGRRFRIAQAMLAVFGAIVALGLLAVQGMMHTICPYCAIVDGSAIAIAALSVLRAVKQWDPPAGKAQLLPALGAVALALAIPMAIGFTSKAQVPDVIAQEIAKTPKGKVTVVDFADFECPFCRAQHAKLEPLLERYKDKVRVTRKNVPLRMHRHAMDAARAACCAEAMGKGDEVAEALFSAPTDELTPEGCERLAAQHGLDPAKFRACVKDSKTDERIRADIDAFHAAKGHGLPTVWFGEQVLEGEQDEATLRAALDSAIERL